MLSEYYPFVVKMTGVVASWQLANDLLLTAKRTYDYSQKILWLLAKKLPTTSFNQSLSSQSCKCVAWFLGRN